jgi:AcrR family transcriptional regulator
VPPVENRPTYHHGALREELMTACIRLIETEGIGAVSLRKVARTAGVSPAAPYHHFTDRAALLNAISARGFQMLIAEARQAMEAAGAPIEALGALIETYVRFAREHTAYVRLMYRPELSDSDKDPAVEVLAEEGIRLLTESVVACQRAGTAPPGDAGPLAAMVWSIAAGLAMIIIDGPLERVTVERGGTVAELTAQISALLKTMLISSTPTS